MVLSTVDDSSFHLLCPMAVMRSVAQHDGLRACHHKDAQNFSKKGRVRENILGILNPQALRQSYLLVVTSRKRIVK